MQSGCFAPVFCRYFPFWNGFPNEYTFEMVWNRVSAGKADRLPILSSPPPSIIASLLRLSRIRIGSLGSIFRTDFSSPLYRHSLIAFLPPQLFWPRKTSTHLRRNLFICDLCLAKRPLFTNRTEFLFLQSFTDLPYFGKISLFVLNMPLSTGCIYCFL